MRWQVPGLQKTPSFASFKKENRFFFFFQLQASPVAEHYGQKQAELTCPGIQVYCTAVSVQLARTSQSYPRPMLPWEPVVTSFSHFNPKARSHLATKSGVSTGWDSVFRITTVLDSWCYCRVWSTTFMRPLCLWDINLTQLYRWGAERQRDQENFPGTYRWALAEEQFESCYWTGG